MGIDEKQMKSKITNYKEIYRTFPSFPSVLVVVKDNIITVSMVHTFSFQPLIMGIGVSPKRYSYSLLRKSNRFSINIPYSEHLEIVKFCGEKSGRNINKFKEKELKYKLLERCRIIEEFPVNIVIEKKKEIEIGDHTWFLGEVVACYKDRNYNINDTIMYWGGQYRIPGKVIEKRS